MDLNFQYPDKLIPLLENEENPHIRYFDIHGGRASGKSHGIGRWLIERSLVEKCRILCGREIQNSIDESSKKLLETIIYENGLEDYFEITNNSIKCVTGSEFIFQGLYRNIQKIKSLEGIKYCWLEEAQSLSLESLKVLAPTIRTPGAKLIFTYNPLEDPDPIVSFLQDKKERTVSISINYYDNPWCPEDIYNEAEELKEYDYDDWLHIYKGDPQVQGDNVIISRDKANHAVERIINDPDGQLEVGADIARYGNDRIQFYLRKGHKIIKQETHRKKSVVETAKLLADFIQWNPDIPIKVDDTGVGGGVVDWLEDNGLWAVPVNNGEKAQDPDRYPNAISEMWFHLKSIIEEIDIPDDQELIQELTRRRFKYDTKGRRCVESKDEYKKRYSHSPDKGDALLLAYYPVYHDTKNSIVSIGNIF